MKLLKWIDENILKILLVVFIFFIPLFPKFPFQFVTYTYISIRIDDFLIALIASVFLIQVVRGKVEFKKLPLLKPILAFWAVVFLSFFSGIYLTKTIDYHFVAFLNTARRVQYMILFFIAFSTIKSVKDFKLMLYSLISSHFLVTIYAIGQRFLDFPAISTMNPEFAKGRVLFLTPEARISSTFAGHYDLAGFLVFLFPILWGIYFYATKKKKITIPDSYRPLILFSAMAPLLLTAYLLTKSVFSSGFFETAKAASQAPFNQIIVYTILVATLIFILLFRMRQKIFIFLLNIASILVLVLTASRSSSLAYLISTTAFLAYFRKFKYIVLVLVLTLGLTYVDNDLINRWISTVQIKQVVLNEQTGEQAVVQDIRSDELPAGTAIIKLDRESKESTESSLLKQDLSRKATAAGRIEATPESYETVTAVAGDISISTRLQVSWPRAIRAFLKNPLLGTGPSTITESSDGDYFRWLGETGGLGFILFLGILGLLAKEIFVNRNKFSKHNQILVFSFIFGIFGLLINALLIDIFEASKVAYTFWFTAGIFIGLVHLDKKELKNL